MQERPGGPTQASQERPEWVPVSALAVGALLFLPAALTVYLGFNAGGYFPDTTAAVTIVLLAVLIARICVARDPFEGFSKPLAIAALALLLYAIWTLLSGTWSNAPARAMLEFDRVLLYLVTLVLFGSIGRTAFRLRWMLRGIALGIAVVAVSGLITRVLPEVWPVAPSYADDRLSYPVTYWNSLGIMAAVGLILCFHLATSRSEPRLSRVLGAAAVPPLAATALFTFSRGAIAAGIIGLVIYVLAARPRALVSGLLATGPTAAVAVLAAYNAELLATENFDSPVAVAQGEDVALTIGLCTLAAAVIRWLLVWLDERPLRLSRDPRAQARLQAISRWSAACILIVGALALDAPQYISDQYETFVTQSGPGEGRQRLFNPGNNGRLAQWDVAMDGFRRAETRGNGAGTYQVQWAQDRSLRAYVRDAHSLYVEVLSELGIVGLALLVAALGTILVQLGRGIRGPNRALYGALLALTVTAALHAGVDWDWEMPVVFIPLLALGGAALAAPARRRGSGRSFSLPVRAGLGLMLVLLALVPAHIATSEAKLNESYDAYSEGDCERAIDRARSASDALGSRPEPYEVQGYCHILQGRGNRAVREMRKAVSRDPENWEYRYDLVLALAASGQDPRPAAETALRLDPLGELTQLAVRLFDTDNRRSWPRTARKLAFDTEL